MKAPVHLIVLFLIPALTGLHVNFAYLLATAPFHHGRHVRGVGAEPTIQSEAAIIVVLTDADRNLFVGGIVR